MDGSSNEWQEGPGLVASVWRYRWLVAVAVLVGGLAAYAWSSRQPVRYEGVIRIFLDTRAEQTSDAGRVVRSQAEFLTSPAVLNRATALIGHRLTSKELRDRLTVEPITGADVITIKVLDATPRGAAELANTVVHAYREVLTEQRTSGARQEVAALERRQRQLDGEIGELDEQLRVQSGNELLQATRQAKIRLLETLADQVEAARRSARSSGTMESAREEAAVPNEPAQPKPLRTAAIGALLALVVAAGLAWWLRGRRPDLERQGASHGLGGISGQERNGLDMSSPVRLAARFDDGRTVSSNGSPTGNGAVSGIADFDQIATSIQRLFHFLNGPSQRLYEDDLPQLTVEEIAHRFKIDMAAILLDNAGEVQTMGSVGLRASRTGTIDSGVRHLIEAAVRSGPRLVDHDELVRLSGMGLGGDQADSLALVPLVRDEIGFGVLLAGRRHGGTPLSDREVGEIADCIRDIVPYVWAWLLLRNLKLRLRTLQ